MQTSIKMLAAAAAMVALSSAAMAQCPPGYALYGNVCQPVPGAPYAPYASNPVSGAAAGGAAGAAAGGAAGGPVGAIVGGAIGTATGTVQGTLNAVTPTPTCPAGLRYYNGACYR